LVNFEVPCQAGMVLVAAAALVWVGQTVVVYLVVVVEDFLVAKEVRLVSV
jgi:hypothetical protein